MQFLMSTSVLYFLCVLIWGSTWFAIEYQLEGVAHEYSSFYRFALAAILLWLYCLFKKLSLKFSLIQHLWLILLGSCMFSMNYILIYDAQEYLSSAMASVIFSAVLIVNIINSRIFFKTPITLRVAIGSLLGLVGMVLIFWDELSHFNLENTAVYGLVLAIMAVLMASVGNLVSVQTQKYDLPVIQMNAYGMAYGAIVSLIIGLIQGKPITYNLSLSYNISLVYLSLFGSVFAFGCYLTLLRRIGVHKASYAVVLFPAVALIISTLFEDFEWTWSVALGILFIAAGNTFVINRKDLRKTKPTVQ
ncbi:DMT family transporter [Kangiella sediminilitoris]|uniref:Membrane protein n=1 Tax=Kangiella sediminilitoris TaxID=1144748 RepID=A0A1B3B9G5_9GAMM|nr:DMT family transporter [Kangiella sediminilitoris]AOE49437.1 membrane protein [Kangiella sediminilitoris]